MGNRQFFFVTGKSGIPYFRNVAIVAGTLVVPAAAPIDSCPGYTVCPIINFQDAINNDPDIRKVNAGITRIETHTLNQILKGQYSSDLTSPDSAKSTGPYSIAQFADDLWALLDTLHIARTAPRNDAIKGTR